MFFLALALICILFLARSALILMGYLKSPIIHAFERYGETEPLYLPVVPLLFWAGMLSIALGAWAPGYLQLSFPLIGLGLLSILFAVFSYQNYETTIRWHYRFFRLPRWYHELRDRTTRYERRRIAYAWLRMPWRAQLIYNSDDRAFFIWADYIIMGTTMDEEDDLMQQTNGAGR